MDEYTQSALEFLLKGSEHVFLTGNAGTGKTTLIKNFKNQSDKNIVTLAPTGVAAINVNGETIHSFFGFPPNVTIDRAIRAAKRSRKARLYQAIEILIIDEISMVRADLLDCIDVFLQTVRSSRVSFGGVRVVMVGDLHQLPPVVTNEDREAIYSLYQSPYFFSSICFQKLVSGLYKQIVFFELKNIYRQTDVDFINLLNRVRTNQLIDGDLDLLNARLLTDSEDISDHILLTTINQTANQINEKRLAEITGKEHIFFASTTGEFGQKQSPVETEIKIKSGAKVMLQNNDPEGRWVNGTTGTVMQVEENLVTVKMQGGKTEIIEPFTWTAYKSEFVESKNKIETYEVGSFRQIPIRLAWAITIHKSQGKTFDKVAIDFGWGSFAHGQTYVALSRVTSLSGLKLLKPLSQNSIISDPQVQRFLDVLRG